MVKEYRKTVDSRQKRKTKEQNGGRERESDWKGQEEDTEGGEERRNQHAARKIRRFWLWRGQIA